MPTANSSGALKRRGLIRLQEYSFALMNNQHTGNLYVSFLTRKSPWDLSVIPGDLLIIIVYQVARLYAYLPCLPVPAEHLLAHHAVWIPTASMGGYP